MSEPRDTPEPVPTSAFKSRPGLARIWCAARYSRDGLIAAVRHEAAFRQELAIGLPLIALAWWIAPGPWQALAMALSIVAVFVVELLNSAVEALADAVSLESHPLIKRAKDMGSAAVMLSICAAVLVWLVALR
ncbi:MAG TPA: diacylglycerol kinase [Burkholderiaceae bacterium]|nr:diacylglycerol kinase [Burkholderiaceae bacterium]